MRLWLGIAAAAVALGVGLARADGGTPPEPACTSLGATRGTAAGGALASGGRYAVDGDTVTVTEPGRGPWTLPAAALDRRPVPPPDREALARAYAEAGRWRAKGVRVKGRGFVGEVRPDGVLEGRLKGDAVAWAFAGDAVFGGPARAGSGRARLLAVPPKYDLPFPRAERATPEAALVATVAAALDRTWSARCAGGGTDRVRLGAWEIPVREGRAAAWRSATEALVVGPEGATWYWAVPGGAGLADALAAEGRPGLDVAWRDGALLLAWGTDPAQRWTADRRPGGGAVTFPLLPRLDLPPVEAVGTPAAGEPAEPGFAGGNALLRALARLRARGGLAVPAVATDRAWEAAAAALGRAEPALVDGQVLPTALPGPAETLALGDGGLDPLARLAAWIADPAARARLLHPNLVDVGAYVLPDGTAAVRGRVLREGVRWSATAWPPDGATDVRPGGPALTVWVPRPAIEVQSADAGLLGPEGQPIPVEVRGPAEGTGADARTESVLHVIAPPLRPDTVYRWRVRWYERGGEGGLAGSFRTAPAPREDRLILGPLAQQVVTRANRSRAERRRPHLDTTAGAVAAAMWIAGGGRPEDARRLAGGDVRWACAGTADWTRWMETPGALPAGDAALLDAGVDRFGAAPRPDGQLCVVTLDG